MPGIITRYYQGILQQIRSEVDLINTLFQHQGIKGEGNEAILRDLVRRFVPKRYGVGTGIIIEHEGNCSKQIDIIIYDTFLYPSLLSLTTVRLFPVDVVYATIEVKTTLTRTTAREALENIASVRKLHLTPEGRWLTPWFDESGPTIALHVPFLPMGVVFTYNSETDYFETFKGWVAPTEGIGVASPTLIACLDQGMLWFDNPDSLLYQPEAQIHVQGLMVPLQNESEGFAEAPDDKADYVYEGIVYPVKKYGGKSYPIDQGRILLLFLLYLYELLASHEKNPKISFREQYFKGQGIENGFEI